MREISRRIIDGEKVAASELPPLCGLKDYLLKNRGRLYGENVLLKIFSALSETDPDIVWLKFVKDAMSSISSSYPLPIHFCAASTVLKKKYSVEDSRAVAILSMELLEQCQNILKFKTFQHPAFDKHPIDFEDLSDPLLHENKYMLQVDAEFIHYLGGTGAKGKELALEVEKNIKNFFESNQH